MEKDPVHLFVGLYDTVEAAERDFEGLKKLYAEGLTGTYDAAVVTKDAEGTPHVDKRRHSGHTIWAGAGIGAVVGVLFPVGLIPLALLGAGTGALVRHAQDSLPKRDAEELGAALASGEAAFAVVSDETLAERIEQVFPEATKRIAKVLDVKKDDFTAALRQAKEEG